MTQFSHAVIGARVAGTYAAWRLARDGAGGPVGLFEYDERIGGRLFSLAMPGMPNQPAELGGMRSIPADHAIVAGLVAHLDLATRPFPMGNPAREDPDDPASPAIGRSRNLLYLRGRQFTQADFRDPATVPHALLPAEWGLSPTELQFRVMRLIGGDSGMSTEEWCDFEAFGRPLCELGFWNLLSRTLSHEAHAFMTEAGGYMANTANANAVYQLPATEYGDHDVAYRALSEGFETLPRTLESRFRAHGGETRKGQALRHIARRGDGSYRLVFSPTAWRDGERVIDRAAPTREVSAGQVILAMPRRALELIDWAPFEGDDGLRRNLRSVPVQQAFKLVLGYAAPRWREFGLHAGRSTTDLPLRQTDSLGSEADYGDDGNRSALMNDRRLQRHGRGAVLARAGTRRPLRRPRDALHRQREPGAGASQARHPRDGRGGAAPARAYARARGRAAALHRGLSRLVGRPLRRGLARMEGRLPLPGRDRADGAPARVGERRCLRRGLFLATGPGRGLARHRGDHARAPSRPRPARPGWLGDGGRAGG